MNKETCDWLILAVKYQLGNLKLCYQIMNYHNFCEFKNLERFYIIYNPYNKVKGCLSVCACVPKDLANR